VTGPQPSLDDSYRQLLTELPPSLRQSARALPGDIEFCRGAISWDACVRLRVCRNLPLFAAEAMGRTRKTASRFIVAHHRSLFYGVLADRLADGQVTHTSELRAIEKLFLAAWRKSLAEAAGRPVVVNRLVSQRLRDARLAQDIQRLAFRRHTISRRSYRKMVIMKLGWSTLTSELFLATTAARSDQVAFSKTMQLLLLGLQCTDDAVDTSEDDRIFGSNIPKLLNTSPATLAKAGTHLISDASELARGGGFNDLARWLDRHASTPTLSDGDRFATELEGMILAAQLRKS